MKNDEWWSRLTVAEKERIASKAASKQLKEDVQVVYPKCTVWWNELSEDKKDWIRRHVTDSHGLLLKEFQEGKMYSE